MGSSIWDYIAAGAIQGANNAAFGDPAEDERRIKRQKEMYNSWKTFREMGMDVDQTDRAIKTIYGEDQKSGFMNKLFSRNKQVFTAPKIGEDFGKTSYWDYDPATGQKTKVMSIPKTDKFIGKNRSKDPNQWDIQTLRLYKNDLEKDLTSGVWKKSDPEYQRKYEEVKKINNYLSSKLPPLDEDASFSNNASGRPGMRVNPIQPTGSTFGKAPSAMADDFVTLQSPSGTVARVPRDKADYFIKKGAKQIA